MKVWGWMTMKGDSNIIEISIDKLIGFLNDIELKYAPKTLFIVGNKTLLQDNSRVSVIGTRNPSLQGKKNAELLTKFLVENSVVIISGLALGIDAVAHRTAIETNGKTVAVLGTPLDKYYPSENRELQNEIMRNHLAISQFKLGTPIQRSNFPTRNRTMALISDASIIVEAGDGSGTYHQGWEALRLGRPLFIVEDILKDKTLKWPSEFMKYGAKILPMNELDIILDVLPISEREVSVHDRH